MATKENNLIEHAETIFSGTGQFAAKSMTDEWPIWSMKMKKEIVKVSKNAKKLNSPKLFALAGKGWELFSIWYLRKENDKESILRKSIENYENAIQLDYDFEDAKISLASLLILRPQVRDIEKSLKLLNDVNQELSVVQELISKAQLWTGNIDLPIDFEYQKVQLIPLTLLREERKKCRALIRTLKKEKDTDKLKIVLTHMYRLAILHDIATHVMLNTDYSFEKRIQRKFDNKMNEIAANIDNFSYEMDGKLAENHNCYLTENDYKTFIMVYGEREQVFDPIVLLKH